MDEIVFSPNSCVEALTRSKRAGAFGEVIKVKWSPKDGTLIQWDWCPYKETRHPALSVSAPGKGRARTGREGSHVRAREKPSSWHLSLHLPFQNWEKRNVCCLRHQARDALLW